MTRAFSTVREAQSPLTGPMSYGPNPLVRDPLDGARSLIDRDPAAQYPSGYVDSAMTTRRSDPQTSTSLWNTKPYDRGVHAASKLDRGAYVWPEDFNLASGLENQFRTGRRYVAPGIAAGGEPNILMNDGKPGPRDSMMPNPNVPLAAQPDAVQAQMLRGLAPSWS